MKVDAWESGILVLFFICCFGSSLLNCVWFNRGFLYCELVIAAYCLIMFGLLWIGSVECIGYYTGANIWSDGGDLVDVLVFLVMIDLVIW